MSMKYVRDTYGVPAKRGMRVIIRGVYGTITSATHNLMVRLDGERQSFHYHPTWKIEYLDKEGNVIWPKEGSTNE